MRSSLGELLRRHRGRILDEWLRRVGGMNGATRLSSAVDHVPALLDRFADALESEPEGASLADLARLHAIDRLDRGFDLKATVTEYAVLRRCVLDLYRELGGGRDVTAEIARFDGALDAAIEESVHHYAEQRHRALVAVDRMTTSWPAGLPLPELLERLLRVFVEASEAVDTSSILLLEDDGRLWMRASMGLPEAVAHRWSLAVGEGFAGTIAATREPRMVHHAAQDPLVRSPYIRAHKIRALYGVPLLFHERLLGVAHMGSRSAFDFSDEDRTLFRALATRAAALISEHLLRADAERRVAELEATLEAIPGEVIIGGGKAGSLRANRAALALFGVGSVDDLRRLRGSLWEQLAVRSADSGDRLRDDELPYFRALVGETVRQDLRLHHLGRDEDVVLHTVAAPVRLAGDVSGAVCVCLDVTDRRRLEQERQELMRKLEAERAQLRALADNMPQLAWMADPSGAVYWYNRRWFEYTGTALEEVQGWGWQKVHHPEHAGRVVAKLREHVQSGRVWEDTFPLRGKDGRYRWFLSRAVPLRDETGRVVTWFGTSTDVTEQKRLDEAREQFLGILGHDLRNPLTAILMTAAALQTRVAEPRLRDGFKRIVSSAERMQRMIADLLDFTRGRLGGGIPIQPGPADLGRIAASVTDEIRAANPTARISLHIDGDTRGRWDAERITQVLQNLVTNAVQHGARDAEIVVTADGSREREVSLRVRNQGPPIPPELLPRLFEPFRRSARGGGAERDRLGLGLYIVGEIVRSHGGAIDVRSTEAEGTTFEVRLPRACG